MSCFLCKIHGKCPLFLWWICGNTRSGGYWSDGMEKKGIWYVRGFEGIHLITAMAFLEPVGVVNSPFWLSLSKFSETFLCNWHIFFHPLSTVSTWSNSVILNRGSMSLQKSGTSTTKQYMVWNHKRQLSFKHLPWKTETITQRSMSSKFVVTSWM